jgi:hypothetical protein
MDAPLGNGRPARFSRDQREELIQAILEGYEAHLPISLGEIV